MNRLLLAALALTALAAPAWATTSGTLSVGSRGDFLHLTYSCSIASGVIDTVTTTAGERMDWRILDDGATAPGLLECTGYVLNTGSSAAGDSISLGVDTSVDGTSWTQVRPIDLTGFVGGGVKYVNLSAPGRYLRFRTINKAGSTKTVTWRLLAPRTDTER